MRSFPVPPAGSRKWAAIGLGTGMALLVLLMLALGAGIQVLPPEVVGSPDPSGGLRLLVAALLVLTLGPAIAYVSGRRAWPLVGLAALAAGVASTVVVGNLLPGVFPAATVLVTLGAGVLGIVALEHQQRDELVGRVIALTVLVAASSLLTRVGVFDPIPVLTFAGLGVADVLAARLRDAPNSRGA